MRKLTAIKQMRFALIAQLMALFIVGVCLAYTVGDVDKDEKVGLKETIYSLQVESGVRSALSLKTINVPGDFTTIQEAIDAASDGDTINIGTGTFNEALTIKRKTLLLQGAGIAETIIDGGTAHTIMMVNCPGIIIQNLAVQNGNNGIYGLNNSSFAINNVIVRNNSYRGIQVDNSSVAEITGCTVENNGNDGIGALRNSAITLSGSIVTLNNGRHGLFVYTSSSAIIDGSALTSSANGAYGIQVVSSSSIYIITSDVNLANNSGIGFTVVGGSSAGIWTDSTLESTSNQTNGIAVTGSSRLYSDGEITISGISGMGLYASGSSNVFLEGPLTISGCTGMGFYITQASSAYTSSVLHVTNCAEYGIGISRGSSFLNSDTANILATGTQQPYGLGIGVWENSVWRANGGTINSNYNTGDGMELGRNSTASIRDRGIGLAANFNNNGGHGISVYQQGSLRTDVSVAANSNAKNGIAMGGNSECRLINISLQSNGEWGINAWDGSSITINDSTIAGNTNGDIVLGFGSRSNLWNNTYSSPNPIFGCDPSVLTVGDAICPP